MCKAHAFPTSTQKKWEKRLFLVSIWSNAVKLCCVYGRHIRCSSVAVQVRTEIYEYFSLITVFSLNFWVASEPAHIHMHSSVMTCTPQKNKLFKYRRSHADAEEYCVCVCVCVYANAMKYTGARATNRCDMYAHVCVCGVCTRNINSVPAIFYIESTQHARTHLHYHPYVRTEQPTTKSFAISAVCSTVFRRWCVLAWRLLLLLPTWWCSGSCQKVIVYENAYHLQYLCMKKRNSMLRGYSESQ